MTTTDAIDDKALNRLRKVYAMTDSDKEGEAASAWARIDTWLEQRGKTRDEILKLLLGLMPIVEQVRDVLREYLDLKAIEYTAVALWILHCHVFDRYMVTPRLALLSPVRGCGKTTVLDVISALAPHSLITANASAASLYRTINDERPTVLIDEADNQGLDDDKNLRAVLNSGHRDGAYVTRSAPDGGVVRYSVFAPVAIAAIGKLPLPLMSRSIVLNMKRSTHDLKKFDLKNIADMAELNALRVKIEAWANDVELNPLPAMPDQLLNRFADNWRPLIAIAESFGEEWGKLARNTAVRFHEHDNDDDDVVVTLLKDIRRVFDARKTDRVPSAILVSDLLEMESAPWAEWRGPNDKEKPRALTALALAQTLMRFRIRPRSLWIGPRTPNSKSKKGYRRADFIRAWDAYCGGGGTTAQSSNIIHLPRKRSGTRTGTDNQRFSPGETEFG